MEMKRFLVIILAAILMLAMLGACGGGDGGAGGGAASGGSEENDSKGTDDPSQEPGPESVPEKEPGVYVLFADGAAQRDIAKEEGEGEEGFYLNYYFSIYACQTNEKIPPGAGVYEGSAKLSSQSDFNDSISSMLEGIDMPVSIDFDMSSEAFGRSLTFDLQKDDSPSDAELRADCDPIFEGGKQFDVAVSAGGYDSSQSSTDTGACPLPMTIEVFGDPQDSVRPAVITLYLCGGDLVLKFDGTLSFVPWSGTGSYIDSDEFKAKLGSTLGE